MNSNCRCGGKLKRTDVRAVTFQGRTVYVDNSPVFAKWVCSLCGAGYKQRKRRSKLPVKAPLTIADAGG